MHISSAPHPSAAAYIDMCCSQSKYERRQRKYERKQLKCERKEKKYERKLLDLRDQAPVPESSPTTARPALSDAASFVSNVSADLHHART